MPNIRIKNDLLDIPAETLNNVIQQALIFTNMFVEQFEYVFAYKEKVAIGTYQVLPQLMKERYGAGTFLKGLKLVYEKKQASKLLEFFPRDLQIIQKDIYTFAFIVFRSFESMLATMNLIKDCQRNVKITETYNKTIALMIERITDHFGGKTAKDLDDNSSTYLDHFMTAFFPLEDVNLLSSKYKKAFNKIGIVLVNDDTDDKTYYAQTCHSDSTEYYRLLNHKEMELFTEHPEIDVEKRLKSILNVKFVEMSNVETDCRYILNRVTIEDFDSIYKDDRCTDDKCHTFHLPNRTNIFVPRTTLSSRIKNALKNGRIIILIGIKGCGKTEMAVDIGNEFSTTHNVFWIDGTSQASLEQSFSQIYKEIFEKNVEDTCEIDNYIANIYNKYKYELCLVIFDNTESVDAIWKYLPKQNEDLWKILITSCRKPNVQNLKSIRVEEMNEDEGVQLFKNYVDYLLEYNHYNVSCKLIENTDRALNRSVNDLIEFSSKHPLIIKQYATYIFRQFNKTYNLHCDWKESFREEINSFLTSKNKQKRILRFRDKRSSEYDESISATIKLTIERLQLKAVKTDSQTNEIINSLALDIFNMLSYFSPNNIPVNIFEPFSEEQSYKLSTTFVCPMVLELLVENLIITQSGNFINVEELFQTVNRINLGRKGTKLVSAVLMETLKTIKLYVQHDETNLNNVLQHIEHVWRFASTDQNVVNEFIMKPENNRLGKTTFFHVLVQYSEVSVLDNILRIAKNLNPEYTDEILLKKNSLQHTPLYCAIESERKQTAYLLINLVLDCEEFIILNQAVMFMCMFVERFEYLFSKKQISKSKIVADEKAGDYFLNKFLLSWMLWINVPKGSFSKSHCTEYFKKKVRKVREMFPKKIVRIRHELFAIAFEVFRSYESLLSVSLAKINSSEVNLEKRFDCFIDVIVDKILTYFELHPFESDGYLLSYFYKACFSPSLCHMICSDELLKMNQVGIVLLDEDSQKKTYFNQIDFQNNTEKYRLLNNKEKKYFNQYETKDPRFRLKQIIGVDFVKEKNVENIANHEYFLDKYCLKNFLVMFKDEIMFYNTQFQDETLDIVKNIIDLE